MLQGLINHQRQGGETLQTHKQGAVFGAKLLVSTTPPRKGRL